MERGTIHITHKTFNMSMPGDLEDCKAMADMAAKQRMDGLYRYFAPKFVTSFSSLDGKVTEHADVTIPLAHW